MDGERERETKNCQRENISTKIDIKKEQIFKTIKDKF